MKIIHFLPWYSPHTKGGTEIFLVSLASSQINKGHHVEIICPNTSEEVEIGSINDIKITYFPFPFGTSNAEILYSKTAPESSSFFEKIIEDINPDVIHIHGFHTIYLSYFEKLRDKYLLLMTPHLVDVICPKHTLINYKNEYCDGFVDIKRCVKCITLSRYQNVNNTVLQIKVNLELFLINNFSRFYKYHLFSIVKNVISKKRCIEYFKEEMHIDVLNPWFSKVLKLNGFSENRINQFPNPVFDFDNYINHSLKGYKEFTKLLFVGRVSSDKGILLLIDALALLESVKNKFSLQIIGKIEDADIQNKLKDLQSKGYLINIVGEIDSIKIRPFYKESDYLIFPSSKTMGEMLPLVIQESLQNNLPVIASDIPAVIPIIRSNINGFLFKADDINDLATVLKEVIKSPGKLTFEFKVSDMKKHKMEYYEKLYQELGISKLKLDKIKK